MTDEEVQALQNELETTKTELEGVKENLATAAVENESLARDVEAKAATILVLEQSVAEKDGEIAALKQSVENSNRRADESEEKFTSLNGSLETTIKAYRDVLLAANQNIPEELITGTTIDELNASVEKAATLVSQVRESIEAELAAGRVPAGAPPRTPPDLSALSPREKIEYAVKEGGKK